MAIFAYPEGHPEQKIRIDGSGGEVTSFNGRTGAVKPAKDDYTADMVGAVKATAVKDCLLVTQSEYDSGPKTSGVLYLIGE